MIGVFDSGVGGLSVLTEIRARLADHDLLYVADRARAPYGTRTLDEVRSLSLEIADWLVSEGATTLVVACNTASAAALEAIRGRYPTIEVVGMEPAVKPAAEMTRARSVGVFATAATFQGELFDSVVSRFAKGMKVFTMACPEWVETVERGVIDGRRARRLVANAVEPVVSKGADVLVLGCTHFSFLRHLISEIAGVPVIDPAPAVARRVEDVVMDTDGSRSTKLAVSGPVTTFKRLVSELTDLQPEYTTYPT